MILLGFNLIICSHNSEPIEPPAPVTQIDLFSIIDLTNSKFTYISSLPSKLSIEMGFKESIFVLPVVISSIEGISEIPIFFLFLLLNKLF